MNLRLRHLIRTFFSTEARPLENNRGLVLFFAFMSAFGLWLIVTLNGDYETSLRYTIQLPEDGKSSSEESPSIRVDAKGSGIDLILAHLASRKDTLSFDFSDEELREGYILLSRHEDQVKRSLRGISIAQLKPEKLYFDYLNKSTKWVELKFATELNLPPAFQLEGNAVMSQDSVLLRGPQEMLDTIHSWKTAGRIEPVITKRSTFEVPVLDTLEEINVRPKVIKVELKPTKYTEINLRIPLTITQIPQGMQVRLNHDYINYTCLVPMDDYGRIERFGKNMKLEIPFSQLDIDAPSFVPKFSLPESLKLIQQKPLQVTYVVVHTQAPV